jgi:hypothetical protein
MYGVIKGLARGSKLDVGIVLRLLRPPALLLRYRGGGLLRCFVNIFALVCIGIFGEVLRFYSSLYAVTFSSCGPWRQWV